MSAIETIDAEMQLSCASVATINGNKQGSKRSTDDVRTRRPPERLRQIADTFQTPLPGFDITPPVQRLTGTIRPVLSWPPPGRNRPAALGLDSLLVEGCHARVLVSELLAE